MDQKERVMLIRAGNELFNEGQYEKAARIFEKTGYRDGLTRVADYYFFDRRLPLNALPYYRLAGREDKVQEIRERMVFALGKMLGRNSSQSAAGETQDSSFRLPPLKVSPKLKILAQEILRDSGEAE